MIKQLEQGKMNLSYILNSEMERMASIADGMIDYYSEIHKCGKDSARFKLRDGSRLFLINQDQPYFISKGSNQAVIDLGNSLVAKGYYSSKGSDGLKEYMDMFPDVLHFARREYQYTRETIENLRKLGISVPEAYFLRIGWLGDRILVTEDVKHDKLRSVHDDLDYHDLLELVETFPNVFVTADLVENGKYKLVEYSEDDAKKAGNGEELIGSYRRNLDLLMSLPYIDKKNATASALEKLPSPAFSFDQHLDDKTREGAIKKMHMLQLPKKKSEPGKLIVGDVDHVYVF